MRLAELALYEVGTAAWFRPNRRYAVATGWFVSICALVVLVGWSVGSTWLTSLLDGLPQIVPLTAFSFLCVGFALARPEAFARMGGGLAAGIGGIRLCQDVWNWQFDLDGFPANLWLTSMSLGESRMSPATAFGFCMLGFTLVLASSRRTFGLFQVGVFTSFLLAIVSMNRYLFGGEPLVALAQMSIPTSLLFFVAASGAMGLRPGEGLARLLLAPTEGGRLMRRLLLPTLLFPPIVGWLCLKGETSGYFHAEAGLSLVVLSTVALVGAFVWWAGFRLDRTDSERSRAERRTLDQLERLQSLHQITRATAEKQDPASIYQVVVRSLEDQLPIDFGCVCVYHPASNTLEVISLGIKSQALVHRLALPEHSVFAVDPNGLESCIHGNLVYEPDVSEVPMSFPQRLAAEGLRSLVLAPLQAEQRVFGILVAARRAVSSFSSSECEFLRQLSENVALASSQAELHAALKNAYFELRETQQMALQQERLRSLGEMASGIAHDINNSLAPAALHAEALLEREKGLTQAGRNRLETLQRAIQDVSHTVARMQELYRPRRAEKAGKLVNLNLLVQQVLDLTRSRWCDMPQERGVVIEIKQDLAADLPDICGSESEIREALTNLVFNAVDAMPKGGVLTIRTSSAGGHVFSQPKVLLEVGDSGIGMNEEARQKCLEPFFTTKGERGSGLGLPMVFNVAQRHEADIEIDSKEGEGTWVRLVFPALGKSEKPPVKAEEVALAPAHALRILVIDDDPILIETLADVLIGDGHEVVTASGGAAGIEAFSANLQSGLSFDLVLTDLGMPQIDGRRVASTIKGLSASTPIILLTGWGHRMLGEREQPAHVDLVLAKPPRLRELRSAIAKLSAEVGGPAPS